MNAFVDDTSLAMMFFALFTTESSGKSKVHNDALRFGSRPDNLDWWCGQRSNDRRRNDTGNQGRGERWNKGGNGRWDKSWNACGNRERNE